MAKSKCELVRKGKAKRKGNRASSFIEYGKVYYTCYGYTDAMTDEPLPEYKRMLHEPDGYPNLIKVIFEDGTDLNYMRYNGKEYKHE